MKKQDERYGPWAIVTGASQGIGEGFTRELARRGYNVVLVSRRPERLAEMAGGLEQEHGIETRVVGADLSVPGAGKTIVEAVEELDVGLLISNAGAASMGGFLQNRGDRMTADTVLNALSHMELSHAFATRLRAQGRTGGILFVSSTAGLQPMALAANYAASKSFVNQLGESLHRELKEVGIDVTVLLPGPTDTPGLKGRDDIAMDKLPMPAMSVTTLVDQGLTALRKRKARHIAGAMNRWSAWLMPRAVAAWMMSTIMRRNAAEHLLPSAPLALPEGVSRIGRKAA